MECSGREERIDHRSHAERGLDELPTIYEGVAARALERKGIVSDRCELNRQIMAGNALLRARERGTLLEEKKTIPAIQIFRQRELAQKIEKLTADIEKLKSEKVFLLNQLHCADDHGMTEIKQRVAAMESSLEKLSQQEARYADELDAALTQYDELRRQAAEYGKRYDSRKFRQSQSDAAIAGVLKPVSNDYPNSCS